MYCKDCGTQMTPQRTESTWEALHLCANPKCLLICHIALGDFGSGDVYTYYRETDTLPRTYTYEEVT